MDDARAAAKSEAQKFNGLTGYLVNITTAQENDFVANKVSVNACSRSFCTRSLWLLS